MATKATNAAGLDGALALRVERVQKLLECSRSQVYALAKAGHLKPVRLGGSKGSGLRICASSLSDFVAAGGCQPSRPLATTPTTQTTMGAAASWRQQARARLELG